MVKTNTPHINDIRVNISKDGSQALLDIITENDTSTFMVSQDVLMIAVGKLGHANALLEQRRGEVDPGGRRAGGAVPMAAVRALSVQTASFPDSAEGAIIFDTANGPQAFAIPKDTMRQVAEMLLREADRDPKRPPLSS